MLPSPMPTPTLSRPCACNGPALAPSKERAAVEERASVAAVLYPLTRGRAKVPASEHGLAVSGAPGQRQRMGGQAMRPRLRKLRRLSTALGRRHLWLGGL